MQLNALFCSVSRLFCLPFFFCFRPKIPGQDFNTQIFMSLVLDISAPPRPNKNIQEHRFLLYFSSKSRIPAESFFAILNFGFLLCSFCRCCRFSYCLLLFCCCCSCCCCCLYCFVVVAWLLYCCCCCCYCCYYYCCSSSCCYRKPQNQQNAHKERKAK